MEDKNLLIKNKNDVTNDLEEEITLLSVSKLPLSKKLVELYKKGVFHLIADTELKHSGLRFAIEHGRVFINISPLAKTRKSMDGTEYKLNLNEFYAFLMGGLVKLKFFDTLAYNRDVINDCMNVYLELMTKAILKNHHLKSVAAMDKMRFILSYYILSNNKVNVISNVLGYSKKISNILEKDFNLMMVKYPDMEKNQVLDKDNMWKIMQNEFIFLKEVNIETFVYTVIYNYGASNSEMIDDLSVTGTIIIDFVQGNRATLNILKNNFIKESIESTMYNNMIHVLSERL